MTIKLKIALYNTLLVSIIVCLVLAFMMSNSNIVINATTKNQLQFIVHENAEEIEWERGKIELDDVNFYENHITTLIYSYDGYLIEGFIPNIDAFVVPLSHGVVNEISIDGVSYFIYDYFVSHSRYDGVYVRGIVSVVEIFDSFETLFLITMYSLPIFIILAGLGSYFISKKLMKPLEKIIMTAQDISNGNELDRRIDLGSGNDEMHYLATTFDIMFEKLEKSFVLEKQFSTDVSHELRTPTAVILAECEFNLKDTSLDEKIDALKSIQYQAQKMQQLINALLNLIRLDNGIQKMHFEEIDLTELIAIVCEEHEMLLSENQKLIFEDNETIICKVDYAMFVRVLSNLIDNGFKYGKDDSFVKISLKKIEEDKILITIEDNGIGISEEHLDNIFNRFYQVDSSRTSKKNSMGLGLCMVKQIVKLHNGSITVTSKENVGTTFSIVL